MIYLIICLAPIAFAFLAPFLALIFAFFRYAELAHPAPDEDPIFERKSVVRSFNRTLTISTIVVGTATTIVTFVLCAEESLVKAAITASITVLLLCVIRGISTELFQSASENNLEKLRSKLNR